MLMENACRPYMYVYSNRSEADELGVINISSVRVDYNRALEKMINVSPFFTKRDTIEGYLSFFYLSDPMSLLFTPTITHTRCKPVPKPR